MDIWTWVIISIFAVSGIVLATTSNTKNRKDDRVRSLLVHIAASEREIFDLENEVVEETDGERTLLLMKRLRAARVLYDYLTDELEDLTRERKYHA